MSDKTIVNTIDVQVDIEDEAETTKRADINSGGLIGALGGGIVGALAGGPVGAIIGAIVGGASSGAAVEIIDNYEHDQHAAHHEDPSGQPIDGTLVIEEIPDITYPTAAGIGELIRLQAYELWEERGSRIGFADEDWLDAERDYQKKTAIFSS
jgi:hypothetical protein